MIPVNKESTENAVAFLTALHKRITEGKTANIATLSAKHKLPQYTSALMKKENMITSAGHGRATVWAWTTIAPNDMMAVEFIKRLNNFTPAKADSKKELPPKVTRTALATKPKEPTPPPHRARQRLYRNSHRPAQKPWVQSNETHIC